jgi:hypothetical protein
MMDRSNSQKLERCRETRERLERENRRLRRVADAFGELAERMNHAVRQRRQEMGGLSHD